MHKRQRKIHVTKGKHKCVMQTNEKGFFKEVLKMLFKEQGWKRTSLWFSFFLSKRMSSK